MRKLKPHPWGSRFGWYPCPYFTLCLNDSQFRRVLKDIDFDSEISFNKNAGADATTHTFDRGRKVICVVCLGDRKGRSLTQIIGLIAHEAMHILDKVWQDAGEEHPSSELKAYAIQHLVSELMKLYRRLKR